MRVILDTDLGIGLPGSEIDDGHALALLLADDSFDVETATSLCLELRDRLGRSDIPVVRERPRADRPRCRPGSRRGGGARRAEPLPAHRAASSSAGLLSSARPNETTVAAVLGHRLPGIPEGLEGVRDLAARARSVVVTLGATGAVWAPGGSSGAVASRAVAKVVDTTGAGDAFAGARCARLASGSDLRAAVKVGVLAGGFAVTREGAQPSYATWRRSKHSRPLRARPGDAARAQRERQYHERGRTARKGVGHG